MYIELLIVHGNTLYDVPLQCHPDNKFHLYIGLITLQQCPPQSRLQVPTPASFPHPPKYPPSLSRH